MPRPYSFIVRLMVIYCTRANSSKITVATKHLFYLVASEATANIHKIERVQNILAKIVLNNSVLPSTIALHQLRWLPVKQRIHRMKKQ